MGLNREKTVALFALLIFALGMYRVVLGLVSPRPDIFVPDTTLGTSVREIPVPGVERFQPEEESLSRDPFSFSEGWQRLETLPLDLPPEPAAARVLPLPRSVEWTRWSRVRFVPGTASGAAAPVPPAVSGKGGT